MVTKQFNDLKQNEQKQKENDSNIFMNELNKLPNFHIQMFICYFRFKWSITYFNFAAKENYKRES